MKSKQQFPEPTVGALIFNPEGELLLVKTHKWKGKFTIPGGHVELGERLVDALRREIKEETGLELTEAKFICYQEFIYDESFYEKRHFLFFDFACQVKTGRVQLNDEAQDFVWVDVKDVDKYPIDSYLQYALERYLKQ